MKFIFELLCKCKRETDASMHQSDDKLMYDIKY